MRVIVGGMRSAIECPGAAFMSGNTFEALLGPNLRSVQTLVQRRLRTSDYAEDLVQEILLRAFQRRDQLRVHAKFRTWLWSIALNEIRSFFRRDRSTVSLEEFLNSEAPDPSMPPLVRLERMERRAWVSCLHGRAFGTRPGSDPLARYREQKRSRGCCGASLLRIRGKNGCTSGRGSGWLKSWHQRGWAADEEWAVCSAFSFRAALAGGAHRTQGRSRDSVSFAVRSGCSPLS